MKPVMKGKKATVPAAGYVYVVFFVYKIIVTEKIAVMF